MEAQDLRITPSQNVAENSFYGPTKDENLASVFAKFYQMPGHFPLFEEVEVRFLLNISVVFPDNNRHVLF